MAFDNSLLELDGRQKFYAPVEPTRANLKKLIGKQVCYVDYIDRRRGYYTVKYGKLTNVIYSRIVIDDYADEVYISNIKAFGVKSEQP